ncbi:MAG: hypothetical protein ACK5LC_07555 [Coprobacillaceae bacterium]
MAPIPKKTKNDVFNKDTITVPVLMVVMIILIICMTIFDKYIHQSLQISAFIFMVVLFALLLFPTKRNKGKNGIQSFVIMCSYKIEKYKERKGL